MSRHLERLFLFLFVFAILRGCRPDEDQVYPPDSYAYKVVNPNFVQTHQDQIRISRTHAIVVAVADSGIDYLHPSLAPFLHFNAEEVINGRDDDSDGYIDNVLGWDFEGNDPYPNFRTFNSRLNQLDTHAECFSGYHGTHVAGIVARGGDWTDIDGAEPNGIGILPIRMGLITVPLEFTSDDKQEEANDLAEQKVFREIEFFKKAILLAKAKGARVLNLSLGLYKVALSEARQPLLTQAEIDMAHFIKEEAPEMIFTVAAGNYTQHMQSDENVSFPCGLRLDNVICVGALDAKGEIWDSSNFGESYVTIFAPGENVLSTFPMELSEQHVCNPGSHSGTSPPGFDVDSGTSMAAPMVAHVIAEMLIENPTLKVRGHNGVVDILLKTADRKVVHKKLDDGTTIPYDLMVLNRQNALKTVKKVSRWSFPFFCGRLFPSVLSLF